MRYSIRRSFSLLDLVVKTDFVDRRLPSSIQERERDREEDREL